MGSNKTIIRLIILVLMLAMLIPQGVIQAASSPWVDISAGLDFSLAVNDKNELWVWGKNTYYQLGLEDTSDCDKPVLLLRNVVQAAAGSFHSLALTTDGTLYAWGWNSNGQIGDGSQNRVEKPKEIMKNVTAIAAGHEYSMAINNRGELYCWGDNSMGQLGIDNKFQTELKPVLVMSRVRKISAGAYHMMAVDQGGTLYTSGSGEYAQAGHGLGTLVTTPRIVMQQVEDISAGAWHSLALLRNGQVMAWGRNIFGQLGTGDTTNRDVPTVVREAGIVAISAGDKVSAAIDASGALYTWGDSTLSMIGRSWDVTQSVLAQTAKVSVGDSHMLAVQENGSLWAWGENGAGQLGLNDQPFRAVPQRILYGIQKVAAGSNHALALSNDGSLLVWGRDDSGQLAQGAYSRNSGMPVHLSADVTVFGTGASHSLAYTKKGQLLVWGNNDYGQLGNGGNVERRQLTPLLVPGQQPVEQALPVPIQEIVYQPTIVRTTYETASADLGLLAKDATDVLQLAGGLNHTLLLKENGDLWVWGDNSQGQLGFADEKFYLQPQKLLENVREIAAGDNFSMAIAQDRSLWVWGENSAGQLGLGDKVNRTKPERLLSGVQAVQGGNAHMLVVTDDNTLWVAGANTFGQLGLGENTQEATKLTRLSSISGTIAIAAGMNHSLAITLTGQAWGWGENQNHQLSDVETRILWQPKQILGEVRTVAAGDHASYLLRRDDTLWTLGSNVYGQLGDGRMTSQYFVPKRVKLTPAGSSTELVLQVDRSQMWALGSLTSVDPGRDTAPRLIDDMTMLPIRAIIEAFGGSVNYLAEIQSTLLELDGHSLQISVDSTRALLDGVPLIVTAPIIESERTLVHIRVVEHLGLNLRWDALDESITLWR